MGKSELNKTPESIIYIKNKIILIILLVFFSDDLFSQNKISINGLVKDAKTNERLIGAIILSDGSGVAISDSSGFFSFYCPAGKRKIECRYIGYENSIKEINPGNEVSQLELFFYLKPTPIELEKVTVTGERYKEEDDFKTYELQRGDLSNIPVFLESDALRAVMALPGITSIHDLSSLIYLRGGNFDETLITLDGVPIYNPYHLGGIFGSFNSDIVDREIIYPSNYPINYQGVLSGVLDIKAKTGNTEKIHGIGSISLISSKLFLEGPLLKGNFILSARRMYPDLLYNMLTQGSGKFPYYFYDFNGKYTLPVDSINMFTISGFYSRDVFVVFESDQGFVVNKREDPNWGNLISSFKYNHLFNNGDFELETYYTTTNLKSDAKGFSFKNTNYSSVKDSLNALEHIIIHNNIKELTVRSQLKFSLTGQDILAGIEYKNLSTSYNWDIKEEEISSTINGSLTDVFFDFAPSIFNSNDNTNILSAFISDKFQLTKSFDLLFGYRGLLVRKIDKYLNSPYILADYKLNNKIKISVGYGKYYEYFFTKRELTNSTYFSPFAIYFISDNPKKIPSSDHFSLGVKVNEILPGIRIEAEGYYKTRYNIITSDELTEKISYTSGYSAGLDILLKKDEGTLTGWIAYSLSRAVKNDNGYWYYSNYDRTHNFKLMLSYGLSENWEISSLWIYSSGMPFTPSIGKFITGNVNPVELVYGKKNTYRYSDFQRLDIGITGNFIWGNFIAKPYLQIMNVYNSPNPFNYDPVPNDSSIEDGIERGSMVIPTIGLTIEF